MFNVAANLRGRRKLAGLTQENVADLMPHWSVFKLSRVENGHQEPTFSEYLELISFYGEVRKVAKFTFPINRGGKPARV